jgi:hypothetical protein
MLQNSGSDAGLNSGAIREQNVSITLRSTWVKIKVGIKGSKSKIIRRQSSSGKTAEAALGKLGFVYRFKISAVPLKVE